MGRKKKEEGKKQEAGVILTVLEWVNLNDLIIGDNIRKQVPLRLIDAMAASIEKNVEAGLPGIDKPLDVEKNIAGKWIIRDGQVRFLGAKKAGYDPVPCLVRSLKDVSGFQLRSFLRNDPGPIDEARAYKAQLGNPYEEKDLGELCRITGKTAQDIRRRLMLLTLEPEIQKALLEGTISAGHGVLLAQVDNTKNRIAIFREILKNNYSCSRTAEAIREQSDTEWLEDAPFDKTKCKTCRHCMIEYPELFDDGITENFKGMCRHVDCFRLKRKEWAKSQVEKLKSKGYDAVLIDSEHTYDWGAKEQKEFANTIELHKYNEPSKKCKNCLKIKTAMFLSGEERRFCTDLKCYRKDKGEGSGSGAPVKELAEKKIDNRVHETTFSYLKEKIAENINWPVALFISVGEFISDKLDEEAIIDLFGNHLGLSAKEKVKFEEEFYGQCWPLLFQLVEKAKKEGDAVLALTAFLKDAVQAHFAGSAYYDDGFLEKIANMAGKQSIKYFRVTEEYLQRMTKDELVSLAGEFKLDLPQGKDAKIYGVENKSGMVKFVLENAPAQCPKEISEQQFDNGEEE